MTISPPEQLAKAIQVFASVRNSGSRDLSSSVFDSRSGYADVSLILEFILGIRKSSSLASDCT